jgi:hypothetical protein
MSMLLLCQGRSVIALRGSGDRRKAAERGKHGLIRRRVMCRNLLPFRMVMTRRIRMNTQSH